MEEKYPCPKMTPKQWIANFWYYYKWFFLLGVVVITLISICTVQYVFKKDADVSILVVGAVDVRESDSEKIIGSAEKFLYDVNGDGSVHAQINTIKIHSDLDRLDILEKEQAREDYVRYSNEILAGDACILILDEYYYAELAQNGTLVNLYGVFETMPEAAIDYYGLRLGDSPLYGLEGFSSLPPDMILCLKYAPVLSHQTEEERVKIDLENEEIFRLFYEGKSSLDKE